jgi:hypothetical protein
MFQPGKEGKKKKRKEGRYWKGGRKGGREKRNTL